MDKCHIDFDFAHFKDEKEVLKVLYKYRNFILQKPELWMFVACDAEGDAMDLPSISDFDHYDHIEGGHVMDSDGIDRYNEALDEYDTAKQKCLFEGFEVWHIDKHSTSVKIEDLIIQIFADVVYIFCSDKVNTISDLCQFNLPLTQTAIDTIYN